MPVNNNPCMALPCAAALRRVWRSLSQLIEHKLAQHLFPVFSLPIPRGNEAEPHMGGGTRGAGIAESSSRDAPHIAPAKPVGLVALQQCLTRG